MDILCLVKDFFLFNATEILTTGYWLRALKRPMKPRPEFLFYTYVKKVQFYEHVIYSVFRAGIPNYDSFTFPVQAPCNEWVRDKS